ncbi:hypothetical protein BCR42DRAFT_413271 [Absidia repens]|uniref:Uncharacterized protein n=1 Tax=Absidia repens TaxID=90262 RepID=A0A1X2IKX2_9FUNG|nr:hypothetical protein BCR42DRAFT_413271 [Absidia repens]
MQWRVFILLFAGVCVVYIVSLLQEAPYPHPLQLTTSDRPSSPELVPDSTILSAHTDYLYETMIFYGQTQRDSVHTGTGKISQLRKPMQSLLQHGNRTAPGNEWTLLWEHTLRGPISKISGPPSTDDSALKFAVLYNTVDNESSRYYVRVYYYSSSINTQQHTMEYKDLLLPGTTWIKSFVLENDFIIYSRDPDIYQYRTVRLPSDLTKSPHSANAQDIILSSSEPGYQVASSYLSSENVEKQESIISQLYSPNLNTLRVIYLEFFKTRNNYYVAVSVADNASSVTQPTSLRDENLISPWHLRAHKTTEDGYNDDDVMYSSGTQDMPMVEHSRIQMPSVSLARSINARTVAFPVTRTQFTTLDYTDKVDILQQQQDSEQKDRLYRDDQGTILPEYYYWPLDEQHQEIYDIYDDDIRGMNLNSQGNVLAVWTENNYIYIYKRGQGDDHEQVDDTSEPKISHLQQTTTNDDEDDNNSIPPSSPTTLALPIKTLSLVDQLDVFLGIRSPASTSSSPNKTSWRPHPDLPSPWFLRMVITPKDKFPRQTSVSTVLFVNASSSPYNHTGNNYLFVGLKNGAVRSYLIDAMEPPQEIGLASFIIGQWDMLIAMCVIIVVFAFNEYQNYGRGDVFGSI